MSTLALNEGLRLVRLGIPILQVWRPARANIRVQEWGLLQDLLHAMPWRSTASLARGVDWTGLTAGRFATLPR